MLSNKVHLSFLLFLRLPLIVNNGFRDEQRRGERVAGVKGYSWIQTEEAPVDPVISNKKKTQDASPWRVKVWSFLPKIEASYPLF